MSVAPLRALHLHSGNLYGGVESILATIARRQGDAPGVHHAFALCFPGRCADELAAAGAPVASLGGVRVRYPWTVLAARRRLASLLRSDRPDVVITHSPWAHAVFAPVARGAGLPLVSWRHGAGDGRHWLERWARRTPPDLVIAVSRYVAASVRRIFPGTRTEVLHAPVEAITSRDAVRRGAAGVPALRRDIRAALATPLDAAVIVQVSRLEEGKGHALLVAALSVLRACADWACWIVGGAQRPEEVAYEARLERRIEAQGLTGRIRLLGQRNDVPALLAAADICCQPNTGPEGFPIAFVEALAAGLPVVTTDTGGGLEVVDQHCGIVVPPGDPRALASALGALLDDPARRAALGAAGPARAAELCEPARQLARLGDLLRSVAGRDLPAPEDRPR